MSRSRRPQLDPVLLSGLTPAELLPGAVEERHEGRHFSEQDVSGWSMPGVRFTDCLIERVAVDGTDLGASEFLETRIESITAAEFHARRSRWRGAELVSSRIGSAELYDSEFREVLFADSRIGYLNLRASTLSDVVFRNCRFEVVDFGAAAVTRVAFEDCQADTLCLPQARAQHLDLRGLVVGAIEGIDGIAGSILSSVQAIGLLDSFATRLGFQIED